MTRSFVPPVLPIDDDASPEQIRAVLTSMLATAQQEGERFLDVTAGGLHRSAGGVKSSAKGVARCCRVMNQEKSVGDAELSSTRGASTTTLRIRYALPRWVSQRGLTPAP